ncbi:multidrug ABC transporter permease [Streptomyces cinnamoneus]|uniref:Transport permease protein n=1 Tax=Streptomyces cinnamoneus TaxID=53446 RepID=A0A2G1XD91_STRCJ|nr:ABC transporter permease [Streptomyces cinnamoneus]PHQ49203.1 multidrug ABC transporter permease [Streptomyces cinnamoneus]PPT15147.1 ABC transporter permease [Streptomyces cinnamoneus]
MRTLLSDTALVFGRYARQTLRSKAAMTFGALMPALYLVLYGPLLTGLPLGDGRGGGSWRVLVPGLLLQLALFGASFAGLGIIIEKQHGVVERMRVTPVSRPALLLGRVLRDAALLTVQSVLLVVVAFAMGLRAPLPGVLIGLAFTASLALSLASLSCTLAVKSPTPQAFAPVVNTVTMPAMLLSGLLLPMSLAPGWLDALSHVMPLRYLVDAVRAAFAGDYTSDALLSGTVAALALTAASVTVGTRHFRRAGS